MGNIFNAEKIKKFNLKKDGIFETRLQTTKFSKFHEASLKEKEAFKNIPIADHSVNGTIIGFTSISCYKSCTKHWNKLDDDEMCAVCAVKPEESQFDFRAELLFEGDQTKDEIQTYFKIEIQICPQANNFSIK